LLRPSFDLMPCSVLCNPESNTLCPGGAGVGSAKLWVWAGGRTVGVVQSRRWCYLGLLGMLEIICSYVARGYVVRGVGGV